MQFRFLEYFIALAEEKHFARAAERCNVTQPTLSAGIAALEGQLGKRLVLRDRRFIGLTDEGHATLPHARLLVATHADLRQAIDATGPLRGELRLGAIPAAMPYVGRLIGALHDAHPGARVAIRQLTSAAIERGITEFELDAGLTYLEHGDPPAMVAVVLYRERYCFATRADARFGARKAVTLAEAVSEPLCLLHQGMQNRRILDRHLAGQQLAVTPVATTDSYVALLSMVGNGGLSSIVTDSHSQFVSEGSGVRLIPISDAQEQNKVGFLVSDREPLAPIARAALTVARALQMTHI
jgi:DNA-binding transcriptional LysR family regulator